MKVLFVCSGNSKLGISPIIKNQGDSLLKEGIDVDYYRIVGKGFVGYLKNFFFLIKKDKQKYDIIHAHYSLSSIVASFASFKPLVVSLMGSDLYMSKLWIVLLKLLNKVRWDATIVKSRQMSEKVKNCSVIPNGVDINFFKPKNKNLAKKKINFNTSKNNIIFVADYSRYEKNYTLAKNAVDILQNKDIKLNIVSNISHKMIPHYMNAADLLLLTSFWEGSPNIVKEAMACNCPIVSTDVGDVRQVIGNTKGCFITSFEPDDVAMKIGLALEYGKRTNGRERIIEMGLDSETTAKKIIAVYDGALI